MLLHGIRGSTTRVNPSWSLTRLVVDRTRNDKCDHTWEIILGDLEIKKKLDPKLSCLLFLYTEYALGVSRDGVPTATAVPSAGKEGPCVMSKLAVPAVL